MASISSLSFFLFVLFFALSTVASQANPMDTKKQPQWLGEFDGTVFIPGMGRFMLPKKGQKLFHYNPITGAPTEGQGASIPDFGGATAPRRYIPGGDDTLLPNPGVEVPIPGSGSGSVPTPTQH